MRWSRSLLVLVALALAPPQASAHPVPFSYLDLHIEGARLDGTLGVHVFDLAHDLRIEAPERILDEAGAATRVTAIEPLLGSRSPTSADGDTLTPVRTGWPLAPARL